MDPDVSVIIPAYEAALFLEDAVRSVEEGEVLRSEVLVIEDGSKDDTLHVATALEAGANGKIRILRHPEGENRGVSASRNLGLREAKGRYVAFLDADDLLLAGHLTTSAAYLDCHPDVAMTFGPCTLLAHGAEMPRDLTKAFERHNVEFHHGERVSFERLLRGDPIRTSSVVGRREAFSGVGGFPDALRYQTEDWILWAKVALRHRAVFVRTPGIVYRYHASAHTARLHEALGDRYLATVRAEVYRELLSWQQQSGSLPPRYASLLADCTRLSLPELATRKNVLKRMRRALEKSIRPSLLERLRFLRARLASRSVGAA